MNLKLKTKEALEERLDVVVAKRATVGAATDCRTGKLKNGNLNLARFNENAGSTENWKLKTVTFKIGIYFSGILNLKMRWKACLSN